MPDEELYEQHLEHYRSVASDVAHNLNNLLLLISGYTEILSKNLDDREQVLQIVKKIQTATSGVRDLTEKLQLIGRVPDDDKDAPITQSDDVLVLGAVEREEIRIFITIDDVELRELASQVLTRGGFDVVEISSADFARPIGHSINRLTNVLILDARAIRSLGREAPQKLFSTNSDVPTLFLVDEASDMPDIVAPVHFSTLSKSFLPSQLISAVEGLYVRSQRTK